MLVKIYTKGIYSHRIGLNSSGEEEREKFVSAGFNVRNGERNTYRVETERAYMMKQKNLQEI